MSQQDVADALGLTRNAVSRWETDATAPFGENLRRLAILFAVDLDWLGTGRGNSGLDKRGLLLRGVAAAGVWREIRRDQAEEMHERIVGKPDPRWPEDAQFAIRIEGTSANRVAPSGAVLHCVDLEGGRIEVRDGDLVLIRRRRGELYEETVRRVRQGLRGDLLLTPETDDPHYQQPVELGSSDPTVSIEALVIYVILPVSRLS